MNMDTVMKGTNEGGLEDTDTNFSRSSSPRRLEMQDELETFPNNDDAEESSGNEEDENLSKPMSEEQFTSLYQHYRNKEDWNFTNNKEFKGFPDDNALLLMKFVDKKSEILYDFYKHCISKAFDAKFEKGKGLVPFEVNGVKAVLINKKIYDQIRNSAKPIEKGQAHTVVKESSKVNAGNISSEIGMMAPPLTSRPVSGPRVIQTPKRYLDGELTQQPKKRQLSGRNPVSKDKNIFQIGLLPPKYPREFEQSPGIAEAAKASSKKHEKKRLCDTSGGFGPFEITHLLQSGELNDAILAHAKVFSLQQKLSREDELSTHRLIMEKQDKLSLEEACVGIERLSNTISNFPDTSKNSMTSGYEREPCSLKHVVGNTKPPPLIPVTAFSSGNSKSEKQAMKRDRDIPPPPRKRKIKNGPYGEIPIPKIPVLSGRTFKKRNDLPISLRLPPQLSKPRMPRVPSIDQSVQSQLKFPNNRERILQKSNEVPQFPAPPPLKVFPQQMNAGPYGDEGKF